jgi:hypothetical protein
MYNALFNQHCVFVDIIYLLKVTVIYKNIFRGKELAYFNDFLIRDARPHFENKGLQVALQVQNHCLGRTRSFCIVVQAL